MSLCRCTLERELSGINRFVKFFPVFFSLSPPFFNRVPSVRVSRGRRKVTYPFYSLYESENNEAGRYAVM